MPAAENFGARAEAQLAQRCDDTALGGLDAGRPRRSWPRFALRIVRDVAIAVALMTAIPVISVARNGDRIWAPMKQIANTRNDAVNPEVFRGHAVPRDPSITPLHAGRAFSRLHPRTRRASFPELTGASHADMAWLSTKLAPGMFPTARPVGFPAPSEAVVEAAVAGFTTAELSYLQTIATAPAWREFDRVARAPAVDFIAGRFQIPFAPNVSLLELPSPNYKNLRAMANAGVSRAAYHAAISQRDSAEAALRSIISFGFAMIDNATSTMDEVHGTAIVAVGGNALERYWRSVGDPRGNWRAAGPLKLRQDIARTASLDETRAWLIARATDPATSRGDRFQAVQELTYSSCTNVRETLLGPRADVTAALAAARSSLTRFPSDRAVVDLGTRLPDASALMPSDIGDYFTTSAATVAGVVLNNPRLATCSRMVSSYLYFR